MRKTLHSLVIITALMSEVLGQSGTKAWYQVLEVKGAASKQTDTFETKGAKWRVRWRKASAEDSLSIYVYDKEGIAVAAISTKSAGEDESYIHKSGTFYLSIIASNSYAITVEDWR